MTDVQTILAPEGAVARRLEGFEFRPQQTEMAAAKASGRSDMAPKVPAPPID